MQFSAWAGALAQAGDGWRADTRLISAGMRLAGASAAYQSLAGRLAIDVPALSSWAALRYAQTGNFTVLHLVTGCRAARVLMPWVADAGDPAATASHLVQAFTAGHLASGVGSAVTAAPLVQGGWDAAITAACAGDDDHVIKLVQACHDQAMAMGTPGTPGTSPDDGPWLQAASRALAQPA